MSKYFLIQNVDTPILIGTHAPQYDIKRDANCFILESGERIWFSGAKIGYSEHLENILKLMNSNDVYKIISGYLQATDEVRKEHDGYKIENGIVFDS